MLDYGDVLVCDDGNKYKIDKNNDVLYDCVLVDEAAKEVNAYNLYKLEELINEGETIVVGEEVDGELIYINVLNIIKDK